MSNGTRATATIVGRMGKDVEIFTTKADKDIGTLSLGTSSGYGDNKVTSWHTVKVFDQKACELLSKYTQKGSRVMVQGEMVVRKYQDRNGKDAYANEVHVGFGGFVELMDSKSESEAQRGGGQERSTPPRERQREPERKVETAGAGGWGDLDDDVPF